MTVSVRVALGEPGKPALTFSRDVPDGSIVVTLLGANGQQLTATVGAVEFFHCIRSLYPELTVQ